MSNLPTKLSTTTLALDPPIFYNGQTWNSIDLREPDMGELTDSYADLMVLGIHENAANYNQQMGLISKISGIPRAAVRKMTQAQFREASNILKGFTLDGSPDSSV